jgi:hypothetical protein
MHDSPPLVNAFVYSIPVRAGQGLQAAYGTTEKYLKNNPNTVYAFLKAILLRNPPRPTKNARFELPFRTIIFFQGLITDHEVAIARQPFHKPLYHVTPQHVVKSRAARCADDDSIDIKLFGRVRDRLSGIV